VILLFGDTQASSLGQNGDIMQTRRSDFIQHHALWSIFVQLTIFSLLLWPLAGCTQPNPPAG
jgi:hypothetical protein